MEDSGELVNLVVKAPDQQIGDQIVKCQLHWTVERLKEHLETVYPTKPKRCDQKVIFSGQLLSDTMVLQDVLPQHFNQSSSPDNTYIVHLVCPLMSVNSQSVNCQTTTSGVHSPDDLTPSSTVQQYYSQLNSQQMAWMQQAYAHYLTQYMHLMTAQGVQLQSNIPHVQSTNVRRPDPATSTNTNQTQNPANREENPANDDNNGEQEAEAGPPANNGEEREAGLNRDWLDVFDVVARVVVLSSIVYFYSSPSRFLVVTFLGFAIYLIQGGFLRGQPAFVNDNGRADNENAAENEPGPPADSLQPRNPQPTEPTNQELRATNPNDDNERPGPWAFTWTFFSSFFASLIPEQQPVL